MSLDQAQQEKLTSLVGDRLRAERERIGIRQADAALLCGVTREMWGRYERGAMPNSGVLVALIGHGFDVNWILGGTRLINDEGTLPERERELLERYRSTDEEGRAAIDRAAAMEALRSSRQVPVDERFRVQELPATVLTVHEPAAAPPAPRKRKPAKP